MRMYSDWANIKQQYLIKWLAINYLVLLARYKVRLFQGHHKSILHETKNYTIRFIQNYCQTTGHNIFYKINSENILSDESPMSEIIAELFYVIKFVLIINYQY